MSPREQAQKAILGYLNGTRAEKWTAPYGVLDSIQNVKSGSGKVRTITFGISRYLDVTLFIWTHNRITAQASGPLSYKLPTEFKSVDKLIHTLKKL